MKFRRGGRLALSDKLYIEHEEVEFVSSISYLGFTIGYTATSFTRHVKERRSKAVSSIYTLPDLRKLSLNVALEVFRLKIAPSAAYGIRQIWRSLSLADLQIIDGVKTLFLKRLLGVSKFSSNTLVYLIASTPTLIEELRETYGLEMTPAYFLSFIVKLRNASVDFVETIVNSIIGQNVSPPHTRA
jgi:hypothetical protein